MTVRPFAITTNTPASIPLELSGMRPDTFDVSGPVAAISKTRTPTQNWTPALAGLTPNTRYNIVVRARDGWGNEYIYGKEDGGNGSAHLNTPSA